MLDLESIERRAKAACDVGDIVAMGALSRNDVPALCREARALYERIDRLRAALATVVDLAENTPNAQVARDRMDACAERALDADMKAGAP